MNSATQPIEIYNLTAAEAIKGATIGWATAKDEGETEPTDDNTNTGGEGGGNHGGELE